MKVFISSLHVPIVMEGIRDVERDRGRTNWESPKICNLLPQKPYFLLFYYCLLCCEEHNLETSRTSGISPTVLDLLLVGMHTFYPCDGNEPPERSTIWTFSFSKGLLLGVVLNAMLSSVRPFVTPWTVACQAPLTMGFAECWSGLPCPPAG